MRMKIALAAFLAASSAHAGPHHSALPLNPAVRQETIETTICVHGYSKTVRPPQAYTDNIKKLKLREAGLPLDAAEDYELDHRIPISAGGAPSDPANLVLQPWSEATEKDRVEANMHHHICHGDISLEEAQSLLWNWKPHNGGQ
jgi:hypothetical protein